MAKTTSPIRRKLIVLDTETFHALEVLSRDTMKSWDELSDEAFRDLLKKHGRADDLKTALKLSIKEETAVKTPARHPRRKK